MNNPTAPSTKTGQVYVDSLTGRAYEDLFGANADFELPLPKKVALTPKVKTTPPPVKDKRLRTKLSADLNVLKDSHAEILQIADALKEERLFAPTLRNGLRLMADLRARRIDVLLELVPFVKDEIMKEVMR